jgi:hypothetical protein
MMGNGWHTTITGGNPELGWLAGIYWYHMILCRFNTCWFSNPIVSLASLKNLRYRFHICKIAETVLPSIKSDMLEVESGHA